MRQIDDLRTELSAPVHVQLLFYQPEEHRTCRDLSTVSDFLHHLPLHLVPEGKLYNLNVNADN